MRWKRTWWSGSGYCICLVSNHFILSCFIVWETPSNKDQREYKWMKNSGVLLYWMQPKIAFVPVDSFPERAREARKLSFAARNRSEKSKISGRYLLMQRYFPRVCDCRKSRSWHGLLKSKKENWGYPRTHFFADNLATLIQEGFKTQTTYELFSKLKRNYSWFPSIFFLNFNNLCWILPFPHSRKPYKNTFKLVGTILMKSEFRPSEGAQNICAATKDRR